MNWIRQWPTVESLLFDFRYALRQLRRQPSFTTVAVLILGLGIGANTAVFSVVDTLLFEPLAFRNPDRLVWVMRADTRGRVARSWTVADYENLRDIQAFEVFPFLGVSPLLGRTFTEEECRVNGPGAVVLSHGLWQRRYGSRTDVSSGNSGRRASSCRLLAAGSVSPWPMARSTTSAGSKGSASRCSSMRTST